MNITPYEPKNPSDLIKVLDYCADNFSTNAFDEIKIDWSSYIGSKAKAQSLFRRTRDHYQDFFEDDVLTPKDVLFVHNLAREAINDIKRVRDDLIDDAMDVVKSEVNWKGFPSVLTGPSKRKLTAEMDIMDAHIGQLIWGAECGSNWDTKISTGAVAWGVQDQIAKWTPFADQIGQILVPWGNDYFNSEGRSEETTGGTPQQDDHRYQFTYRAGRKTALWSIKTIAESFPNAEVGVIIVPGNHDEERMFTLGDTMEAVFENHPRIWVDNSPSKRKYFRDENVLLGWSHGKYEKLEQAHTIMMEEREDASSALFKEMKFGHYHSNSEWRILEVHQFKSMRMRILNALTPSDEWHSRGNFIKSLREARGFLYHSIYGLQFQTHSALTDGWPNEDHLMALHAQIMA